MIEPAAAATAVAVGMFAAYHVGHSVGYTSAVRRYRRDIERLTHELNALADTYNKFRWGSRK